MINVSVSIPVEKKTKYLAEALDSFSKQTYSCSQFEVLIASSIGFKIEEKLRKFVRVVVEPELAGNVGAKRNVVLRQGRGEVFIFTDDDVLAPQAYIERAVEIMKESGKEALCGPLLTPPEDDFWQKAGGAVWESCLGSFGAGLYRSVKKPARWTADFPGANLIIKRELFEKAGGFAENMWPGEDTKLCLDIKKENKKGIWYDPRLYLYHRRKPLWREHLKQAGRYGRQRGRFALAYPQTSFKLRYFIPSLFLLYTVLIFLLFLINFVWEVFPFSFLIYSLTPMVVYFLLLIGQGVIIAFKKGIKMGAAAAGGIIATHFYYGWQFWKGWLR